MLFRQLEYFVALARERHFARAAAACYVSQPALSEAIRKLEHELDVPLVYRDRVFQGLTPEGERLVIWARRILADHESLKQEVAAIRAGLTGQLRIGAVQAAATTVALLVAPFCAAHPMAGVRVDTLPTTEILRRLRDLELDTGLIYLDESTDLADLAVRPLYQERYVLIAPAALVKDLAPPIKWTDVAQLPLCLLNTDMPGRTMLDRVLAEQQLTVAPQVQADSIATLYAHMTTGQWASVVPQPWIRSFPRDNRLRAVTVDGPPVHPQVALVTTAAEPGSVLAAAFARTAAGMRLDELFARELPPG
jgi:DNA-binding transcriptional LysR family regulator